MTKTRSLSVQHLVAYLKMIEGEGGNRIRNSFASFIPLHVSLVPFGSATELNKSALRANIKIVLSHC